MSSFASVHLMPGSGWACCLHILTLRPCTWIPSWVMVLHPPMVHKSMVSNTTFLAPFRLLLLKLWSNLLQTLLVSFICAIVLICSITNLLPVNATQITLSVPLNTNVVGGIVSQKPLCLPVDLSFKDSFTHVCAHMELNPLNANIGYKFWAIARLIQLSVLPQRKIFKGPCNVE